MYANGDNRHREDLAHIIRQETQDGRLIVRFLVDAMQGELDGAKPHHRLDAARQLLAIGFDDAEAFIDAHSPDAHPRAAAHTRPANAASRRLDPKLAELIRQETDDGRTAVRFLVDVMQGALPDFKPHHRLAAARELLRRGFDDTPDDDPDDDDYDDYDDDCDDDTQDDRPPWNTLAEENLLIEKYYGNEDMRRKAVENTVFGQIQLEDRKTFENLPLHEVEALVEQYGSPQAWFAAVEKFVREEATLEQLRSGSIDTDADDHDTDDDAIANDDDTGDESRAPPDNPPPEDDEHRPDPGEPSKWDLRAANKVLDSTTQMEYHRSYW